MENIKGWVMDDTIRFSNDDHIWKDDSGATKCLDSEMLKTYSTGILAVCLAGYASNVFLLCTLFYAIWKAML